jgi:hypothetical protein
MRGTSASLTTGRYVRIAFRANLVSRPAASRAVAGLAVANDPSDSRGCPYRAKPERGLDALRRHAGGPRLRSIPYGWLGMNTADRERVGASDVRMAPSSVSSSCCCRPIFLFDREPVCRHAAPCAPRFLGRSVDELLHTPADPIFAGAPPVVPRLRQAIETGAGRSHPRVPYPVSPNGMWSAGTWRVHIQPWMGGPFVRRQGRRSPRPPTTAAPRRRRSMSGAPRHNAGPYRWSASAAS